MERKKTSSAFALPPHDDTEARSQLPDLRRLAERTLAVVRDMSLLLRPSMLDDVGLIPVLQWQAREVSRTKNLAVHVHADELPEDIPDEHKTCIYRLVQKVLHNITRDAKAKNVDICLSQNAGTLLLTFAMTGKDSYQRARKAVVFSEWRKESDICTALFMFNRILARARLFTCNYHL